MMNRGAEWLLARSNPRFGYTALFVLLCCSFALALSPFEFAEGPRSDSPATLFFWIPVAILQSPLFFTFVRVLLVASTALWMFRKCTPWSSWATVFFFTLMWSLRMENVTNGAHIFNLTNWLLIVHASWFHFYHDELVESRAKGNETESMVYPRWVFVLCLFYIGWFHSLAGVTKIWHSGFFWGNGVSLQLWVQLFGWESSPFSRVIQWDSRLTAVLQTGALLIECASILVVFNRTLRYLIGVSLFGFYLGVLTAFIGFGFHANAIIVLLFLFPFDRWLGMQFESNPGEALNPSTETPNGHQTVLTV